MDGWGTCRWIGGLLGGLAVASSAAADGLPMDLDLLEDPFDIEGELALLAAEDIVVSATRYRQPISESPSAITLVTREQILASGYDNLPDLLRLVPGVDVLRISQAWAPVGIRSGTSPTGDLLLVLIDGRDVAFHLTGSPLWHHLPVGLDEIERIEVIRGPGSAVYGANGLQGVVNIVTRESGDAPFRVEPRVFAAGPATLGGSVVAHGRLSPTLSWWASGGYEQRTPYDRFQRPSHTLGRARGRVDWSLDEDRDLRVEAGLSAGGGRYHLMITEGPAAFVAPYLLSRLTLGDTTLTAVAEHTRATTQQDFALVMPPDSGTGLGTLATLPLMHHASRSLELTGVRDMRLGDVHRLVVGATGRVIHHYDLSAVTCPADLDAETFDPDLCDPATLWELRGGVFVQDEWSVTDTLKLTAGGRLDVNSLHPEPGISPRLAAVWRPRPDQALRAGVGRAYRKPSFMESRLSFIVEPDDSVPPEMARWLQHLFATQLGNHDLRNTKIDAVELGWRGRLLDERLTASVDLFVSVIHDAVLAHMQGVEPEVGFGGVIRLPTDASLGWENVEGSLWSWGGEVSLRWRPTARIELTGAYAMDRQRAAGLPERDLASLGERTEPVHRLIGSARLRIVDGLRVGLDAFWASRHEGTIRDPGSLLVTPITQPIGARTLMNANVGYTQAFGDRAVDVAASLLLPVGGPIWEFAGAESGDEGGVFGARPIRERLVVTASGRF